MIFEKLKRHQNEDVKLGAEEPLHMIQAAIILNDVRQAVMVMHEWVLTMPTGPDGSPRPTGSAAEAIYLRFFASLLACWRHVGVALDEVRSQANHVVHCYVRLLIAKEEHECVATYVAEIVGDPDLQVFVYSDYLKRISDRDAQRVGLERAKAAGLPVGEITKVRTVLAHSSHSSRAPPLVTCELSRHRSRLCSRSLCPQSVVKKLREPLDSNSRPKISAHLLQAGEQLQLRCGCERGFFFLSCDGQWLGL
jgi:hypothetical protein